MKDSIYKIILFLKRQKVQYLLSFCLFILLFVFGSIHATKGIDLTDEGMYLSTAMRLSMGDTPFRDEFMSNLSQFSLLVSPLFMIYSDISLLQMRCLGLLLHTVSIFTLFLLLSRYAPPFFVTLACSAIFFSNVFIMCPSYNSLSRDFSIIAIVFWLFSCLSSKRTNRTLFSIFGGFFFTLVVLSYSTQFFVICIPLAVTVILYFSSQQRRAFYQPTVIFIGTFATMMLLVLITVASFGLLPDFIQGYLETAVSVTGLGFHSPWIKAYNVFKDFLYAVPHGLKLIGIFLIAFLIVPKKKTKSGFVQSIVAIIIGLSSLGLLLSQSTERSYIFLITSFTLILGILSLLFNGRRVSGIRSDPNWTMVQNCAMSWGFMSSFVYGISSSIGFRQCIYGIIPIFIVGMISLYRFIDSFDTRSSALTFRKTTRSAVLIAIIFSFTVTGLNFHYNYTYREEEVEKLTSRFKHPKLTGIYSTPEKVTALEELLAYLDGKVKPDEYFLCYNYIPMLYFLTHTRPAYGAAWARNDWPISIRKRLIKKMIDDNKIPKYCVRMMAFPGRSWKRPNRQTSYSEEDPLNAFVMSNYYLDKIIYPFEIWRHGRGRKFRLLDQMVLLFKSSFLNNWNGPDNIYIRNLAKTAAPLMNLGNRGDFKFTRISTYNCALIRVSPAPNGEKDELVIQFGYTLNKNGLDIKLQPGQEVIFTISTRLSNRTKKPTLLFVQDKKERWERNSVIINKTSFDQYIVSKRIREGATKVCFGIYWQPDIKNQWIEIKNARIFVAN